MLVPNTLGLARTARVDTARGDPPEKAQLLPGIGPFESSSTFRHPTKKASFVSNPVAPPRAGLWQRWFKSLNNLQNQYFFYRIKHLAETETRRIAFAPLNRTARACYQTLRQELADCDDRIHLYDAEPERYPHFKGRNYRDFDEKNYGVIVLCDDQAGPSVAERFAQRPGCRVVHAPHQFIPMSWINDGGQVYGLRAWLRDTLHDAKQEPWPTLQLVLKAGATNTTYWFASLMMRLLRPFVRVRILKLRCDRIGHFAANTDVHLAACAADPHRRTLRRYYYPVGDPIANHALKALWDKRLPVLRFGAFAAVLNQNRADFDRYFGALDTDRDPLGHLNGRGPFVQFTKNHHREGQALLRKLGVPENTRFFVFHARDAHYLKAADPNTDYSYHNYRDVTINHFKAAVNMLTARGYYAVRVGSAVEGSFQLDDTRYIDYALSPHRSPFGDLYLCGEAAFMLGSGSGIDYITRLFRRPVACTNIVPLGSMGVKPLGLFIPKKIHGRNEQRLLTYDEIVNGPSTQFFRSQEYEAAGLTCIENTAQEILDLADELEQRAAGTWVTTDEDEALQAQFWRLFSSAPENQNFCRIGAAFLRQNPELLAADAAPPQ